MIGNKYPGNDSQYVHCIHRRDDVAALAAPPLHTIFSMAFRRRFGNFVAAVTFILSLFHFVALSNVDGITSSLVVAEGSLPRGHSGFLSTRKSCWDSRSRCWSLRRCCCCRRRRRRVAARTRRPRQRRAAPPSWSVCRSYGRARRRRRNAWRQL